MQLPVVGQIVQQQQYKLHAKAPKSTVELANSASEPTHKASEGTPSSGKSASSASDPFFCVGDYSVALQPPTPFPALCCCRSPRSTEPLLGGKIDHLCLVEGLLTVHCFRTIELALLMVLACAFSVGVVFFFSAQAMLRAGFLPSVQRFFTAADLIRCAEGAAVLGAPQVLSCFRGAARVDPGAALEFAQAMAASGGSLTFNASQLAAATCAPVLGAMTSAVSRFMVPGLMQKVFRFSEPFTAEIAPSALWLFTAWSLVPLAALLLIDWLACDKRAPVPRKADSLRRLFTAEAREFMMCVEVKPPVSFFSCHCAHKRSHTTFTRCFTSSRSYAWNIPRADKQRARVIAHLLPDCWLDVQTLTMGASVPEVIQQQAVWSRCLVVYGTRHYFASKNCLRELLSALLFRRVLLDRDNEPTQNIALLLDDSTCTAIDCRACMDASLTDTIKRLKSDWNVKVFTDLALFWTWVGERGDAGDVSQLLQWYRDVGGRPRALQLTDRLSNLVHTETMISTGLCLRKGGCRAGCYDYCIVQHLFWCCPGLTSSPSRRSCANTRCWRKACCFDIKSTVRFGQLLHGDTLSLLEAFGNLKEYLFVLFILAFMAALSADLYFSPPQSFAFASGSDIAAFLFFTTALDVFSLLLCVLVLLPSAAIVVHQTRPSTYYSNFLEPLCIAAHALPPAKAALPPSSSGDSSVVVVNPLQLQREPAGDNLPIFLVAPGLPSSDPRMEKVYVWLRTFLTDMGFQPKEVSCDAHAVNAAGTDRGLFVFFLTTATEGGVYLSLAKDSLAAGGVDRMIPVLFNKDCESATGMFDRLFVPAYPSLTDIDEDERCRGIGADILKALSKRVASALLGKVRTTNHPK